MGERDEFGMSISSNTPAPIENEYEEVEQLDDISIADILDTRTDEEKVADEIINIISAEILDLDTMFNIHIVIDESYFVPEGELDESDAGQGISRSEIRKVEEELAKKLQSIRKNRF